MQDIPAASCYPLEPQEAVAPPTVLPESAGRADSGWNDGYYPATHSSERNNFWGSFGPWTEAQAEPRNLCTYMWMVFQKGLVCANFQASAPTAEPHQERNSYEPQPNHHSVGRDPGKSRWMPRAERATQPTELSNAP